MIQDDGYEGASYDDRSANDYESDAFSMHDAGYTEEEHIAATIIQCMVRARQRNGRERPTPRGRQGFDMPTPYLSPHTATQSPPMNF
jgi:hypothetical protein